MSIVGFATAGAFLSGFDFPHLFLLVGLTIATRRVAAHLSPATSKGREIGQLVGRTANPGAGRCFHMVAAGKADGMSVTAGGYRQSMRVLVTDGDSRAALAVVRSLGRRGHHVVVGERRTPALAQQSRYCNEQFTYPDPFTEGNAFISGLASEVERRRVDVLLPVSDVTAILVATERASSTAATSRWLIAPLWSAPLTRSP